MSTAPEEFDKLQKLLKLKRYEQPPPGYFNNFSTNVINRLEREIERGGSGEADWIKRFLGILETNPIAAGLFGMSVCGLLISGIAYSQSRTALASSDASNVIIDVADSGMNANTPQWTKTASVDSLAPSTSAVFGTNEGGTVFDGISLPKSQLINLQLSQ